MWPSRAVLKFAKQISSFMPLAHRARRGCSRSRNRQPPGARLLLEGAETMTQHNRSLVTGLTFVAALGGLLFGYDTAVISGAVSAIDANLIEPLNLSETARGRLSGWTVSSALCG